MARSQCEGGLYVSGVEFFQWIVTITCVVRWALAVVGVDTVYTHTTILAVVAWTVINVMLTVLTCKT